MGKAILPATAAWRVMRNVVELPIKFIDIASKRRVQNSLFVQLLKKYTQREILEFPCPCEGRPAPARLQAPHGRLPETRS